MWRRETRETAQLATKGPRRVGEDVPGRGAPRVFTTRGCRSGLGRARISLAFNTQREVSGAATGVSEVERRARRARGQNPRAGVVSAHRSAHGVVKTPSAPVFPSVRGVARRHGHSEKMRLPHDYDGCPFWNQWMSRCRSNASLVIGASVSRVGLARVGFRKALARANGVATGDLATKPLRWW